MRLDGRVNKIERITARSGRSGDLEEKRVFHLNVRLPDQSLQAQYNYGYGQMHFILHGKAMEDFADLDGEVDVYVQPKGLEYPNANAAFDDLRTDNYRLEGEVKVLTTQLEQSKKTGEERRQENVALRERLQVAMHEVMRLEARLGQEPPASALLEDQS